VQFDLRAIDLNNNAVPNLNSVSLAVYENGQLVPNAQVTPHTDGPVHYIFVIDLGRQSNYNYFGLNNVRQAITTLVSGGYFVDGTDTVEVWGRQNLNSDQTATWLAPTKTGADLTNWASNFNFQRSIGPTKGLLGVEDALSAVADHGPDPGLETTAIILITRFIEEPKASVAVSAAESLAQEAKQHYVTVSTFHIDTGSSGRDTLQTLAAGSNGSYVHLLRNSVATAVTPVYQQIAGQRSWYTVKYRSLLGHSGTRLITINTAEAPDTGQVGRYDVNVTLPNVTIVEPNPGSTIQRQPALGADGQTWTYPDSTISVKAQVDWPGGVAPRQLTSAQLLVNGVLQDSVTPAPGDTQVQLKWDISDIVAAGMNTAQAEVQVTDELGVQAVGDATLQIEVIPPPTPVPESPVAGQIKQLTSNARPLWVLIPLGLIGLLLAVAFSGVILFLTRPASAAKVVADIRNTLIGGSPRDKERVLATLKVMDGPHAWIGETINLSKEKTSLGRNPQVVDIPFYRDEQSSISRLHATIQLDRNSFLITDHNSTSGTRVNGEYLKPNSPVQLRDGDEIVMGDLTQRGVKLRFSYLLDKTELPASAPAAAPSAPAAAPAADAAKPPRTDKTMYDGFKWDEDKWNEDE
jgi:hypothetical protein